MTKFDKAEQSYEADIKELMLDKEHMFGDIGDSVVLFEKAMSTQGQKVKKVIADMLIFTEHKGIIGAEMKTFHDSTQRLLRQLRSYTVTCDYTYVICHDNHVPEVERILKRHKFHHVGIIAYREFQGKPLPGVYMEALKSPTKSTFHALNMLWKVELLRLLSTLKKPHEVAMREQGRFDDVDILKTDSKYLNSFTKKMKKSQIISEIIAWLGEEEANKVLCQVFIQDRLHIERAITMKHFNPPPKRRELDG